MLCRYCRLYHGGRLTMCCASDYTLKYSNGLAPLAPGESVKVIMFDVTVGKSRHIEEMILGETSQRCWSDSLQA